MLSSTGFFVLGLFRGPGSGSRPSLCSKGTGSVVTTVEPKSIGSSEVASSEGYSGIFASSSEGFSGIFKSSRSLVDVRLELFGEMLGCSASRCKREKYWQMIIYTANKDHYRCPVDFGVKKDACAVNGCDVRGNVRLQSPLSAHDLDQGLQTFLPKSIISYYTTIRGTDIFRNVIKTKALVCRLDT